LFKKCVLLKVNSPGGETSQTEMTVQHIRILKTSSAEGETPQTERAVQPNMDYGNELPQREDPTARED